MVVRMLIAEKVFLLFTTDSGKACTGAYRRSRALSLAVVMDLLIGGIVQVEGQRELSTDSLPEWLESERESADPIIRVHGDVPTDHYVFGASGDQIRSLDGRRLSDCTVKEMSHMDQVVNALSQQGVIEKRPGILRPKHPALNPAAELEMRQRLQAVLEENKAPTTVEAILLAIILSAGATGDVFKAEAANAGMRSISGQQLIQAISRQVSRQVAKLGAESGNARRALSAAEVALVVAALHMGLNVGVRKRQPVGEH